ncbi:MAG TPA: Wzz/FepE/Etk N-terminal domain-containing protein, partial [Pyrinomonadaceae bacterium]|nr:Wzz/FepE/Etk N-terminal domain-containing protein [Pyrinomonadaceae bacterium]
MDFAAAYPSSYEDSLNSKRSIKQYFNVVYKRLPIILAITILVTAAVAFYSYRLPPEYEASTSMIIEPRKPPQTSKDTININLGDDQKYYNTQLELLKSPALMRKAVIALGLHRDANVFGDQGRGLLGGVRSLFNRGQKTEDDNALPIVDDTTDNKSAETLSPEESKRADAYAALLASNLTVNQQQNTYNVTITLRSSNPVVTAKSADMVAKIFQAEDADRETKGAKTALDNLEKSINDLDGQIHHEEDVYIETMTKIDLPLGAKGSDVRAADLQALILRWRDAQYDTGKAQANYSAAVEASNNGNILAVSDSVKAVVDARAQLGRTQQDLDKRIQDFDKKIDEKNQKKEELLVRYQPEYKEVKAIVSEIAELEKQKNRVVEENTKQIKEQEDSIQKTAKSEVLASLKATLSAAQQKEAKLRASLDQTAAKANIDGQAETTIVGQQRELASNRALLDSLRQRQKEQQLA